jgi:hypothetical protein
MMSLPRTFRNLSYCTILLLSALILMPAFAQAYTLTVSTDKASYTRGQVMKITAVFKRDSGTPITNPSTREVRIKNPSGNEVVQTSMTNAGNGVYTYNYTLSSSAPTGTWEVRAKFAYNGTEIRKYTYPSVVSTTTDTTAPVTTASPLGGSFTAPVTVSLARNEAGTTYYTTNGTTPTTSSAVYSTPLTFSATTTLKYFSRDTAGNSEAVKTQTYTISTATDTTAPITSAAPAGGSYTSAQTVTLTRNEAGTTYYTTNGTTPTTSSAVYSAPLSIAATTTLKYFSRDTAGNSEAVKTQTYTIGTTTSGHAGLTWTGYGLCTTCHNSQAQAMYQSVHYQWKGSAAEMTTGPTSQGKMDAIDGSSALNAYCINIQGNWGPCGSCHVGTGAKPVATTTPTAAQLAGIDCLMCHNDTVNAPYSRVRNATTGLFEPAAGLDMNLVAQKANIKPTRKNCLGCHAKAGGGDAVKRGDIALASGTTSDVLYDTHMAMGSGGNLQCQGCHTFTGHRVAGRGTDLRPEDTTAEVTCSTSSCHATKTSLSTSHSTYDTSHHVGRVACQTCHLPKYAKNANDTTATEATETNRTWATSEWNATLNRYEPLPTKANDLIPKYAFWNGTSWGNNAFNAAVLDPATGAYKISRPNGAINDPVGTKLYPFKYKTANQPLANGKLVTLSTATYFATGNYDQAVKDGLVYMGLASTTPYTTVTTDELQLLNHQIPPASGNVLACADCHGSTARMNLPAMGYALKGSISTVCIQCHGSESNPGFTSVHSRHVANYKYDCSFCHNFSRATERGLKTTK